MNELKNIFLLAFTILLVLTSCSSAKETSSGNAMSDEHFQRKFFAAQQYKAMQNEDKAYAAFQECLMLEPNNAAVHYEIARIESVKENTSGAIEHMEIALGEDKENYWYRVFLADLQMYKGEFDDAEKNLDYLIKQNPSDIDVIFKKADLLIQQQKFAEAVKVYDDLEQVIGVNEELSFYKAQLYSDMGKTKEAIGEMEKLVNQFPNEAYYKVLLAQSHLEAGNKAEAEAILEEVSQQEYNSGLVHLHLSEYYSATGNETKSFEELKKAFGSTDVDIDTKIGILMNFYAMSEYDQIFSSRAYQLLDISLKVHPDEPKIHAMYGDYLWRDNRGKEAIDMYSKTVVLDPSRSMIWSQLLMIELQLSDYTSMKGHADRAAALFPTTPEFYWYKGVSLSQLGDYDGAINAYNAGKVLVIENPPLLANFYSSLGESYNETKAYKKSDESFDKSIELVPDNPYVLNNYSYYLSLRLAKLDKAESMSKRSNEIAPGTPSFQDTYAWILYQQKKYDEALKWIESAINNGANSDPEVLEHYGDILFALDRKEEALAIWKMAIESGADATRIQGKIDRHSSE